MSDLDELDSDFSDEEAENLNSDTEKEDQKNKIISKTGSKFNKSYSGKRGKEEDEEEENDGEENDGEENDVEESDDESDQDDEDNTDNDDDEIKDSLFSDDLSIDLSKTTDQVSPINSDVESDDENYLQKFDIEEKKNYVNKYHPECITGNSMEIESLTKIIRDSKNNIIDSNHKTQPFLSKYEKTKILGQRASQVNGGAKPYIDVPKNIIDGYLIAQLELKAKKIPIIIRRPIPNGKSEYWKLEDLEQL